MQFTLGSAAVSYISATPIAPTITGVYSTDAAAITAATTTALGAATVVTGITGDVTLDMSTDDSTLVTRESAKQGFKSHILGLSDGGVKFTLVFNPADTNFGIMITAWATKVPIFYADLSQDKSVANAQGLAGNFFVKDFSNKRPVESGAQVVDVSLIPASANSWYKSSGS